MGCQMFVGKAVVLVELGVTEALRGKRGGTVKERVVATRLDFGRGRWSVGFAALHPRLPSRRAAMTVCRGKLAREGGDQGGREKGVGRINKRDKARGKFFKRMGSSEWERFLVSRFRFRVGKMGVKLFFWCKFLSGNGLGNLIFRM
jgi:hypothetical protein